jgi:hypothetical protein
MFLQFPPDQISGSKTAQWITLLAPTVGCHLGQLPSVAPVRLMIFGERGEGGVFIPNNIRRLEPKAPHAAIGEAAILAGRVPRDSSYLFMSHPAAAHCLPVSPLRP